MTSVVTMKYIKIKAEQMWTSKYFMPYYDIPDREKTEVCTNLFTVSIFTFPGHLCSFADL